MNGTAGSRVRALAVLARDWPAWSALWGAAAGAAWLYPRLPARVPVHWNAYGQPDGWAARDWAVGGGLVALAGLYALFWLLPKVDPWGERYARFAGAYRVIRLALAWAGSGAYLAVLLSGAGVPLRVDRWAPALVGGVLVAVGNVLPQLRPNFFVGIRTPWTLADEHVWRRTHRLGGRLFAVAGLLCVAGAVAGGAAAAAAVILAVAVAAGGSLAASYAHWRRR